MAKSFTLGGCAPTPLASYLKALGILRLLSSHANHVSGRAVDPGARGWWEDERFHLRTTLDPDALCQFFSEDYAPSPIIAPWNGGSGFYQADNKDGFGPLSEGTVATRFKSIAEGIRIAHSILNDRGLTERPQGDAKVELVATLRAQLPDTTLEWIDAALALSGGGLAYPQLLGTGGNDGRLDFTNNFMRRLVSKVSPLGVFDVKSGETLDEARPLLTNALFGVTSKGFSSAAIGQFEPSAAGGPNGTVGYEANANVNSWDFILMLEGAVTFAGATTRRHQGAVESGASFPFTVRVVGAGWGGVEATDENSARAEFWAPLWERPARFCEISALLAEGRAVLNGRTARDGLDFARAAASLGINRGFSEFERYAFLMRSGKAYFATPLSRCVATPSLASRLVADLDAHFWLDRLRRFGRRHEGSSKARNAIKRLEDALFALTTSGDPANRVQRTLVTLGEVCNWLAVSREGRETIGSPPPMMSSEWIRMADDGSAEFRVAAALAGLGMLPAKERDETGLKATSHNRDRMDDDIPIQPMSQNMPKLPPPMAAHFAPIEEDRFFNGQRPLVHRAWLRDGTSSVVVWGTGNLVSNMIAVLERRLVETVIRGLQDKPLAGATHAHLSDIAAFLSGDFDDRRCAALLAGMIWVRPTWLPLRVADDVSTTSANAPFAYAALKPVFTSDRTLRRVRAIVDVARVSIPPGLITRLRVASGSSDGRATDEATRVVLARARVSGLSSPFDAVCKGGRRAGSAGGLIGVGLHPGRLAAALLIPLDDYGLKALINRAYPSAFPENHPESTEDTTDVA